MICASFDVKCSDVEKHSEKVNHFVLFDLNEASCAICHADFAKLMDHTSYHFGRKSDLIKILRGNFMSLRTS